MIRKIFRAVRKKRFAYEPLIEVEEIAKTCGTIPYEILVHIPPHLRRKIV